MRWMLAALILVVTILAGVCAYEYLAIKRAEAATPAILARARLEAGPPLLAQLPPDWVEALLAVEDPSFRTHHGVDDSTPGAGQTTITQGLVKRLYFQHFHAGFQKIEQILIARYVLDPAISKDEQLNLMLGLAYLGTIDGRDIIGFRSGAEAYFHKQIAELTKHQFLELVAMLIAPNNLDPLRHARENAERVARIERMLAHQCAPMDHDDTQLRACAAR